MKQIIIGIAMALFAGTASASDHSYHQEARTAQQLVNSLERLASVARQEEYNASRTGDYATQRSLSDIRDTAQNLASAVEGRVLGNLYGRGGSVLVASREFNNLRFQFDRLFRAAQSGRYLPWTVTNLVDDIRYQQNDLSYELSNCYDDGVGPRPIPGPGPRPIPGPGPRPIPGPGPRPNPGPSVSWQCTAKDAGWEEHGGGHVGYGRDQREAQYEAVANCERLHGQCYVTKCSQQRF